MGRVCTALARVVVLGGVREDERRVPVGDVVLRGVREPGRLLTHQVGTLAVGPDDPAVPEAAGAAPEQARVAGHLPPGRRGAAEPQGLVTAVGDGGRKGQRPGSGHRVHVVHLDAALLVRPQRAVVRMPGEPLGDDHAVAVGAHLVELDVCHRPDTLREFEIPLSVNVCVAAPQVRPRQMRGGHLQTLVPAVVVGPVVRDNVARERPERVQIRLRGLPGRLGAVHVAQQVDTGGGFGDRDAVAVGVDDAQAVLCGHADASSCVVGAQPGAPPCRAV